MNSEISFFEKYLSVWVLGCIVAGILIGEYLPGMPAALNTLTYANVSLPIALLIWMMIYPMMMKVDFSSIRKVGHNSKGLIITTIINWGIKPFTMFGIG